MDYPALEPMQHVCAEDSTTLQRLKAGKWVYGFAGSD